tara:strand:- start:8603 stop:9211 length:609 start_codon:yes stop_codon:yes gene_type:complete
MRIESIKGLNITTLFSEPLEQKVISGSTVVDLLKESNKQKDLNSSTIEGPGIKVIIVPDLKKDFVFENVRVLINDKGSQDPTETSIMEDLNLFFEKGIISQKKVTSYGFNFDALVNSEDSFEVKDLISKKIANLVHVSQAGVSINFIEEEKKYMFEIKPVSADKKYLAHLNVHYPSGLSDIESIKKDFVKEFLKFKDLIDKI